MNNPHRIRLVLADVDGTLVRPDKTLTERSRAAVYKLADEHIAFAITSGRPPRGLTMLVEPLRLETPIAAFNGAMMVSPEMTPIDIKTIPSDIVIPVVHHLIERGLDVWIYQHTDWFLRDLAAPHADREQRNVRFTPTVTQDLDGHAEGAVKIVGVSDDRPLVAACEKELREQYGDRVSAARSQPYYLDVTHPDANKGAVVRRLSVDLGVPRDAIATLGDMDNDIEMFIESGLSIAMGQASEDVRRAARRVTQSNAQEGFAEAIERFVLADAP
ncbi:MAG TPA: Cof-type HAD-IIB family hydrolase [Polyangiaceae bacterium]|nr:Cof-type HAD-IIB family hydrolase [Polyangiaceae bacterium]